MPRLDRLSALVAHFVLDVAPAGRDKANLAICCRPGSDLPGRIIFTPTATIESCFSNRNKLLFMACANWGGSKNPLVAALPGPIEVDIRKDQEMQCLATLLIAESSQQRCGSEAVINRLGEVLLVRLFRSQVATGTTELGLLGGLADERLSPAIVAMHEHPGQTWSVDQLAQLAGLSASRFADRFTKTVGQTPMSYLRHWRMILAQQDVKQGDRIQIVATRYGYASTEALSRAFRRHFGSNPTMYRP